MSDHDLVQRVREMRLPRAERQAARAERASERQMRRERDSEHSAARRAAATEAESRRQGGSYLDRTDYAVAASGTARARASVGDGRWLPGLPLGDTCGSAVHNGELAIAPGQLD